MSDWISVDNELPEHEKTILLWDDELSCFYPGFYCEETGTFNDDSGDELTEFNHHITHWMYVKPPERL